MDLRHPPFDSQTIARLQTGDPVAWEEVVDRLGSDILAFVRSRNASKAEDLYQTIWLKAWRSRTQIVDGNLRSWLFSIARNLLIDAYRKHIPESDSQVVDLLAQPSDPPDPRLDALAGCIESLDASCRQLVQRFYLDQATTMELADELQVANGTIASRASRCRKKLRECVEKK